MLTIENIRFKSITLESETIPLVSVIVPSYNYGRYIGETLESLIAQTYTNWECVVVDDGSTDNTKEVVSKYIERDTRINYFYQENRGLSAARNSGIKYSTGKYIQLLDADDLIDNEKLERQFKYLEENPEVDILYGDVLFFSAINDNRPEIIKEAVGAQSGHTSGKGRHVLLALLQTNIMVCNSPLFRRSVLKDVTHFDENLKSKEDLDFWMRCAAANKCFRYMSIPGTLAFVRSHRDSMHRSNYLVTLSAIEIVYNKAKILVPELNRRNFLITEMAFYEGLQGLAYLHDKKLFLGWSYILRSSYKKLNLKLVVLAIFAPLITIEQRTLISTKFGNSSVIRFFKRNLS